jgi:hypothetical protein
LQRIDAAVRDYLRSRGGVLALAAVIVQLAAAHFVFHNQPEAVRSAVAASVVCRIAGFAWFAAAALILAFGAWVGFTKPAVRMLGWLGAGVGFLAITTMTLFRDGLRDAALLVNGFDVWQRAVSTNWGVVVLFLLLFVGGLAVVGWLISVMLRAEPVSEKVA